LPTRKFKNVLLHALDGDAIARLHLVPIQFALQDEIEYPGSPIERLCFVEEGMASMTTTFRDGSQVEVGMFGYESVIGVSALMGTKLSLNRVYTQIAGHGWCSPVSCARKEFQRGDKFQQLALAYVQAQLVQAMQSAGCNAKHDIVQRLSRWLLLCADRANSNTYKMSHEYLADMLGSTRPTVTLTAGLLKDQGLIRYSRGTIHIVDPVGLEKQACECYRAISTYLHSFADFDSGISGDVTLNRE